LVFDHLFVDVGVPEGFVDNLRARFVVGILFLRGQALVSDFKVVVADSVFENFGFSSDFSFHIGSIMGLETDLIDTGISWLVGHSMAPMFFVKNFLLVTHREIGDFV
jgi:hypothetical protein